MNYFSRMRQISLRASSIAFILAVTAAVYGRMPEAFGVLIGQLAALINFRLLSRALVRQLTRTAKAAATSVSIQSFFRYALMVLVVLSANAHPGINVWAVFVGLVLIKAVIFGEALFVFAKRSLKGILHSAGMGRGEE